MAGSNLRRESAFPERAVASPGGLFAPTTSSLYD